MHPRARRIRALESLKKLEEGSAYQEEEKEVHKESAVSSEVDLDDTYVNDDENDNFESEEKLELEELSRKELMDLASEMNIDLKSSGYLTKSFIISEIEKVYEE